MIILKKTVGGFAGAAHLRMKQNSFLPSLGFAVLLSLAQTGAVLAATAPPLGAASSFAVLGGTTVTNTGTTTVNGDVGVSPGTITGSAMTVNGTIHAADATAASAQTDTSTAYNALTAQACDFGPLGATDLAGATLAPGVYCYSSTLQNSGILTLDAGGNSNAVWVFRIGSTLTTASASSVAVINGGKNSNVFWQVGSSATLGTTTTFAGNILALTSITLNTGATVSGRVLAQTGTVTLDGNNVSLSLSPAITLAKSAVVYSDPVNTTTDPKAIPGSKITYTIQATNSGAGAVDSGTTVITDPIPANTALFVNDIAAGSGPVLFTQGATTSGLTYAFTALGNTSDDVDFSNDNGATWAYVPIPDVGGCDPLVTNLRINPQGAFIGNAQPNPSFSLSFRVCVK